MVDAGLSTGVVELPAEREKALGIIDEQGDGLPFGAFRFGVEFLGEMVS